MSRNQKLISLKEQEKLAEASVKIAQKHIIETGFQLEAIKEYNLEAANLGIIRIKINREQKYNKPEQFMDEYSIPGNIFL